MSTDRDKLAEAAAKLRIGGYHRHVLMCVGHECCSAKAGEAAWDTLKKELKDRGLAPGSDANACFRTKAGCLRVCREGPVAVVYPEGTWYCGVTADRVPRLVAQHLVSGQPVEEWVFARNPMPLVPLPSTDSA